MNEPERSPSPAQPRPVTVEISRFWSPEEALAVFELIDIHLSRQDKVAQAVSLLKAEQSGLWHRAADGTERERTAPPAPLVYEADRLAGLVEELETDDAAWNGWFSRLGIEPLRVTCEGLAAAPRAVLAQVLSALALDPRIAASVDARTAKLADETSLEWARRFRRAPGGRQNP